MRKKLIALFTAVMVLTGYSLPAFAEEIEPDAAVVTENADSTEENIATENDDITEDISDDTDATVATVETVETEDSGEITEDTVEQPDTESIDSAEETSDEETDEDTADKISEEKSEDSEPAQTEEQADTDTDDTPNESTEELLEDELELNALSWVKSWDAENGTLTLQGQLPDTYARGHDDGAGLAELAGIRADKVKKIVITSGTKAGTSTAFMFGYMGNLSAIEGLKNLDTSNVTDMNSMFYGCSALKTLDLSSFDTSKVILMSEMFYNCRDLTTLDLSSFDTSKVIQMSEMFYFCLDLTTLDLSSFDTSKVLTMRKMFYTCDALTTLDLSSFDTSKVRTMSDMFNCCSALTTLDVSSFDTSNVTDMSSMFDGCLSLTTLDLSSFNTSNVTDMSYMFRDCPSLTSLDLSSFDTSKVTDMDGMFYDCYALKIITVSDKWSTASVTTSAGMFNDCTSLKGGAGTVYDSSKTDKTYARIDGGASQPGYFTLKLDWVQSWDKDNGVLTLQGQLPDTYDGNTLAELLGLDIYGRTDSVKKIVITSGTKAGTSAAFMFCYLDYLTEIEGLENLDTSNTTNMKNMFWGCRSLKILDLSGFDTSKVTEMDFMFAYCSNLTTIKVSDKWTTAAVGYTYYMFERCEKLRGGAGTVYNRNKTDASYAHIDGGASNPGYFSPGSFTYPAWVKSWDSSTGTLTIQGQLPDTRYNKSDPTSFVLSELAGIDCIEVKKIVITSGTKAGTSAEAMFHSYKNLTEIQGLANLDTSTVTDMSDMFRDCSSLTSLDLSGFKTSNVTNMSRMFSDCSSLTSLDLSSFNTSNVTDMSYMFSDCSSLTSLDLSSFNTSNVTDMSYMFSDCSSLTSLDLSSFNTSNVTNMSCMFDGCKSLTSLDLSHFNTSKVTSMYSMFGFCTSLTSLDLLSFSTSNVTNMAGMFGYCKILTAINVSDKWNADKVTGSAGMFYGCTKLKGGAGTTYDSTKTDKTYARIDKPGQPGYLTAKSNLPAKPVISSLTPSAASVTVKWNAVSGATSYRVYQKNGTAVKFLKEVTATSYTDTGLKSGTKYGYLVRAFNTAGGTAYTDADWKYVTTAASAPVNLAKPTFTVTAGDKSVTVKWNAVSGATSYRVYQKNGTAVKFLKEVTTTSYTDTGLTNGTKYGYLVRAFAGTTGTGYTDADWKYATPVAALAKPTFSVTAGDKSVTVKWNAVSGATSYRVYRKTGTSVAFLKEVTTLTYTDTGLTNGTKYGYLVRAFKGTTGTGYTDADWKFATPAAATTLAKPNFTVTAATGSSTVKWSAVSGAASYRVYRMDGTTVKFLKEVTTLTYTDTTVANGTKYGYLVRAFKGSTGSAYTNADFKYVTPLAKPTVTLTPGTKQVTIKWNKVTGATSYRVYRIDGSAITALTNTTGTSYTATGLTTGTKYGFTVRAFNGNDASTYASTDVVYTTAK